MRAVFIIAVQHVWMERVRPIYELGTECPGILPYAPSLDFVMRITVFTHNRLVKERAVPHHRIVTAHHFAPMTARLFVKLKVSRLVANFEFCRLTEVDGLVVESPDLTRLRNVNIRNGLPQGPVLTRGVRFYPRIRHICIVIILTVSERAGVFRTRERRNATGNLIRILIAEANVTSFSTAILVSFTWNFFLFGPVRGTVSIMTMRTELL